MLVGTMGLNGRIHVVEARQHHIQCNLTQLGWQRFVVVHAVSRANDMALGNIFQLIVHVVQESAWNVVVALRKTCM